MKKPETQPEHSVRDFSHDAFLESALSDSGAFRTIAALEADGDYLLLHPEGAPSNILFRIGRDDVRIVSRSFQSRFNGSERTYYNLEVRSSAFCTAMKGGRSAELLSEFSTGVDNLRLTATLQVSIAFRSNGEGTLVYGGKSVPCLGKPGQAYPRDQIIENIEGVQYEGDYGSAFKFRRWVSSQFVDPQGNPAVMLWSVKIDGLHGIFIHEDPDTLASNGGPSQGCIHLANPNSKSFYDWVTARTRVQISYPW